MIPVVVAAAVAATTFIPMVLIGRRERQRHQTPAPTAGASPVGLPPAGDRSARRIAPCVPTAIAP